MFTTIILALFGLMLAAFAVIGDVEWLKALTKAVKAGKGWFWPMISGLASFAVGIVVGLTRLPGLLSDTIVPSIILGIFIGAVLLSMIELCYQLIIQTMIALFMMLKAGALAKIAEFETLSKRDSAVEEEGAPVGEAPAGGGGA
jgi:hypothetical protein